MTDRELLELAAKAAGYIVQEHVANGAWVYEAGSAVDKDGEPKLFLWRPRDDDGDALRLAVRLKMLVDGGYCCASSTETIHEEWWGGGDDLHAGVAHDECDPNAATRRAITRAAAEIGKGMP